MEADIRLSDRSEWMFERNEFEEYWKSSLFPTQTNADA